MTPITAVKSRPDKTITLSNVLTDLGAFYVNNYNIFGPSYNSPNIIISNKSTGVYSGPAYLAQWLSRDIDGNELVTDVLQEASFIYNADTNVWVNFFSDYTPSTGTSQVFTSMFGVVDTSGEYTTYYSGNVFEYYDEAYPSSHIQVGFNFYSRDVFISSGDPDYNLNPTTRNPLVGSPWYLSIDAFSPPPQFTQLVYNANKANVPQIYKILNNDGNYETIFPFIINASLPSPDPQEGYCLLGVLTSFSGLEMNVFGAFDMGAANGSQGLYDPLNYQFYDIAYVNTALPYYNLGQYFDSGTTPPASPLVIYNFDKVTTPPYSSAAYSITFDDDVINNFIATGQNIGCYGHINIDGDVYFKISLPLNFTPTSFESWFIYLKYDGTEYFVEKLALSGAVASLTTSALAVISQGAIDTITTPRVVISFINGDGTLSSIIAGLAPPVPTTAQIFQPTKLGGYPAIGMGSK